MLRVKFMPQRLTGASTEKRKLNLVTNISSKCLRSLLSVESAIIDQNSFLCCPGLKILFLCKDSLPLASYLRHLKTSDFLNESTESVWPEKQESKAWYIGSAKHQVIYMDSTQRNGANFFKRFDWKQFINFIKATCDSPTLISMLLQLLSRGHRARAGCRRIGYTCTTKHELQHQQRWHGDTGTGLRACCKNRLPY